MHMHLEPRGTALHLDARALRLLLPIDATPRSRWGLAYAQRCRDLGARVSALLLYVGEPIADLNVLRFRTQEEMRALRTLHGNSVLDDASAMLGHAGIDAAIRYREGDIAFEILDAAEQAQCDEIVLPAPQPRWTLLLARDVVRAVRRSQRGIPVTVVGPDGNPARSD